jgi:hypothetical protein
MHSFLFTPWGDMDHVSEHFSVLDLVSQEHRSAIHQSVIHSMNSPFYGVGIPDFNAFKDIQGVILFTARPNKVSASESSIIVPDFHSSSWIFLPVGVYNSLLQINTQNSGIVNVDNAVNAITVLPGTHVQAFAQPYLVTPFFEHSVSKTSNIPFHHDFANICITKNISFNAVDQELNNNCAKYASNTLSSILISKVNA